MDLAKEWGINDYPCPSGGCLLTDPRFADKLREFLKHNKCLELDDVTLLRIGRHFRLAHDTKLIVGRHEVENETIEQLKHAKDFFLYVPETGSPNALLLGGKKHLKTAAAITARYSDKRDEESVEVFYKHDSTAKSVRVKPLTNEEIASWRI